ncbi:MAG TPA: ATP-binding protein [Gemmatimonadales bacterium]|nr:ATP-binding protein [Gemmatimonadales bacterium]
MTAGRPTPLALVGTVARLLRAGYDSEVTLARVLATLRADLPAASARLWRREPGGAGYRSVERPPAAPLAGAALPDLPAGGVLRFPIESAGELLGALDVEPDGDPTAAREALAVVADLLARFLAADELSEDLAYEVAVRAREVEHQRRFTSLVIDSLPIGLYVVDRDYRIQVWNRKRETGTQGLLRGDVVGREVFDVLTRQDPVRLRAEFDEVFRTGRIHQVELTVPGEGGARTYRLSKIPMRLGGEAITHVITIGEDVTEWRSAQESILQSEKLAAIGQLAAGVMHEINNPLATISACVAALEGRIDEAGPALQPALREYLEIVEKEVQRCTRIVDQLLDFSRPTGSAKVPVAVNALVEDTLFLLKHHKRFRRVAVTRALAADLPPVRGNAEQLIQVLMALLLNAADAVEHGGTLTVRTGLAPRPDEVIVAVEDTGPGIPPAELSKIFEPFFTTKPQGRGTGLGLSICYGIIEDHRGRIEVDSQVGRGSTFQVFLPTIAEAA